MARQNPTERELDEIIKRLDRQDVTAAGLVENVTLNTERIHRIDENVVVMAAEIKKLVHAHERQKGAVAVMMAACTAVAGLIGYVISYFTGK